MLHKRGPWSTAEDANLLALVHHHGPQNWVRISQHLGSRSPKQCRERYHQNLKPTLNHSPITPQEGELIEGLVKQIGRRWADISRRLPGRSDNAVKNWWNGGVNRRRRVVVRRDSLSKAPREIEPGSRPFIQTPFVSLADQRILPASMSQPPLHAPLMSPVRSEVSMPDSMGDAPSLASDHSSQHTVPSPGSYSRGVHLVPNAGIVTPGLWYRGSSTLSGLPSQQLSPRQSPSSPIILPLAGRFDPSQVSSGGRLQHLSEIAANEDLLPLANNESCPASKELASRSINCEDEVRHFGCSPPAHDRRVRIGDAQSLSTLSSKVETTGNIARPAPCLVETSSPAPSDHQRLHNIQVVTQRPEAADAKHFRSGTFAKCQMGVFPKITDRRSNETPDDRKDKMTLSSILL